MGRTREELLRSTTPRELAEAKIYYELEPFGQPYIQSGIIASVIANVNRKKSSRPFSYKDFIPKFVKRPPIQTPEEQSLKLMDLAKALGAVRKKDLKPGQRRRGRKKKARMSKLKREQ